MQDYAYLLPPLGPLLVVADDTELYHSALEVDRGPIHRLHFF